MSKGITKINVRGKSTTKPTSTTVTNIKPVVNHKQICQICNNTGISKYSKKACIPCANTKGTLAPLPKTSYTQTSATLVEKSGKTMSIKGIVPFSEDKKINKNEVQINTGWGSIVLPINTIKAWKSNLPKLPFETFTQISSFLQWCSLEKNSEGRIDLTLVNGEWITMCFYQSAQGTLDVTVDLDDAENQALLSPVLKEAFSRVHCTIHSHNRSPAFQSGTDVDDEMDKTGWHITLGNYGSGKVDNHARFTVRNSAQTDKDGNKVLGALNFFFKTRVVDIVETPKISGYEHINGLVNEEAFHLVSAHPKEWEERFKKLQVKTYNYPPTRSNQNYMGFEWDEHEENWEAHLFQKEQEALKKNNQPQEEVESASGENAVSSSSEYSLSRTALILEFEELTKIDYSEYEIFIDMLNEPKTAAEEIIEWFADKTMTKAFQYVPTERELNIILFMCNDRDELPAQLAIEILERAGVVL